MSEETKMRRSNREEASKGNGEGTDVQKIDIAYQNKDITSKFLAENLKGKTFGVYGLKLPEIKRVLPTNIPTVKANELRLDNLFELADGTVALVDYESDYNKDDKIKYLNYLAGIANRYQQVRQDCPQIHMIVIYTGDIERSQVLDRYDIGALQMHLETAFLSELDSERIFRQLREKVERNQVLSDEELMEFIILPLSYRQKEEKQERLRKIVDLAVRIQDGKQQIFTLAGLLVFTDKIIDQEMAGKIRRVIEMTKVAQIFEEEKRQALAEQEERNLKKLQEERRQIVINMIKRNYSAEEIVTLISSYSQDDVEQLRKEIERGQE